MNQEQMNILVPQKLREMEKEYDITILSAAESGSRAWGFASPDSDFDVRFIYKRKPEAYLKLNPDRDVIELPVDDTWDVNGWDLDKSLKLLNRTNPTFYEWLNSPICYVETDFRSKIDPLLTLCFSEKKMLYHYLSTAKSDIRHHLDKDTVKPKKYFYALRPVLACRWIMAYHSAPPVPFDELRQTVLPEHMKDAVEDLLDIKINSPEKLMINPIKEIDDYLEQEIQDIEKYLNSFSEPKESHWDQLNEFFCKEIGIEV